MKKNIYEKLLNISVYDMHKFLSSLNDIEKESLLDNEYLVYLDDNIFRTFIINLEFENSEKILNNKNIYNKIIEISKKEDERKNILYFLKNNIIKELLENKNVIEHKEYLKDFINKSSLIRKDFFYKLNSLNINFDNLNNNVNLKEKIINKYNLNINDSMVDSFISKIKNNTLNIIYLEKIKNYKEFNIYTKFGIYVPIDLNEDLITLNKASISYDKLISVNEKQINKIIKLLKNKYENIKEEKIFEVSLKMYFSFGYDISKKIIDEKFCKLNNQTINRIVDFEFKKERIIYRKQNPDAYYNHKMLLKIKEKNYDAYKLLFNGVDKRYINIFIAQVDNIINNKDDKEVNYKLKLEINDVIQKREKNLKEIYRENVVTRLLNKNINKNMSFDELYELLCYVDLNKVIEYNEETKNCIIKTLFGNGKKDNDCLFRLIYLNESNEITLEEILNNADLLVSLSKKNSTSLQNIISISGYIRINKFNLKPDEKDVTLSILTKIINSKCHCNITEQQQIRQTLELHKQRKEKYYATIPYVKGETKNKIKYEVIPFDSDELLAAGAYGKNCLKIGGSGEDFFKYCLLNKNAVLIYLTDVDNTKYVCPIIRTGNGIHCNGIDPEFDLSRKEYLIEALEDCFKKICYISSSINKEQNKNIQIATLTSHNMKKTSMDYEVYNDYIPIPKTKDNIIYHCDYNTKEVQNFVIYKTKSYEKNYFYESNDIFYCPRPSVFSYILTDEIPLDVYNIINSLLYSKIDDLNISSDLKNERKQLFKPFSKSEKFNYLVGNKDWFIGLKYNNEIICVEPKKNNIRALKEFKLYSVEISKMKEERENENRKNL